VALRGAQLAEMAGHRHRRENIRRSASGLANGRVGWLAEAAIAAS
jgi:hypothetical protein